jgi:hypothetical protein
MTLQRDVSLHKSRPTLRIWCKMSRAHVGYRGTRIWHRIEYERNLHCSSRFFTARNCSSLHDCRLFTGRCRWVASYQFISRSLLDTGMWDYKSTSSSSCCLSCLLFGWILFVWIDLCKNVSFPFTFLYLRYWAYWPQLSNWEKCWQKLPVSNSEFERNSILSQFESTVSHAIYLFSC